uniref:Efflux transporter outer membrane subunit n=1 Tax=Desulfobacca acetoxidans TaxID=60893 RepID=A0A7C3V3R7_9BACT
MTPKVGYDPECGRLSRNLGLAILSFLTLAGCAVGPNFSPPKAKVPEAYYSLEAKPAATPGQTVASQAVPQPVVQARWWQAFRDPILDSLVSLALASNLDLQTAEARIREARAVRGMAAAGLWPQINASALYQRSQSSSETVGPGGGTAVSTIGPFRELFQVGLDASWELDIFGGTRRGLEAATADLQAAVEDRRDVLITLVSEVGTNYLNLRGFQHQADIARKNLEAQKKTAEITHKRFQAGFVSRLDVANADAQVATTAATIPTLESSAQAAIFSLGVLLGKEPAFLAKELASAAPMPPTPPKVPVGLPSDLLRRRPDIRQAEAQLHAATARIGVAVADLFPKFNLTGSLGFAANDIARIGTAGSRFWSFSPSVTWPVFAGGKIRWNVEAQKAIQEQVLLQYQQTVLTALKDVETALVAYAKEQERRNSLATAVENNRQAVDLAMRLYVAGKTDFLNVLNAQRNLFLTEDALTQSTRNLGTDLIALYKALGGGWEPGG